MHIGNGSASILPSIASGNNQSTVGSTTATNTVETLTSKEFKAKLLHEASFSSSIQYRVEGGLNLAFGNAPTLPDEYHSIVWDHPTRCTSLTSLPENLSVGGDFFLTRCTSLTSLPDNLSVEGSICLNDCINLSTLPANLSVRGDFFLYRCTNLTTLPDNLSVRGTLCLNDCISLSTLPEGLSVWGGLDLTRCTSLTTLPDNLSVGGALNLTYCSRLRTLPENLSVAGYLDLSHCSGLTTLSESLSVGGNLDLPHCRGLTSLPESLSVGGNLNLFSCSNLTSLPENFSVGGSLYLYHCTSLTTLPESFWVGGNSINLSNCTSLTTLPENFTRLGTTSTGGIRSVHMENTGLSQAIISRLENTNTPGMRFYFSNQASLPEQQFVDFPQAFEFWKKLAKSDQPIPDITARWDQLEDVIRYMGRLTSTADYKNSATQSVLAKRVLNIIPLLTTSKKAETRELALHIIHIGLESCDDRIIQALDELTVLDQLKKAEYQALNNNNPSSLMTLGRQMMYTDAVQRVAQKHMETLKWIDEVEVVLAFQIGLKEALNLPASTQDMIFRQCAKVTASNIAEALATIKGQCTEEYFGAYLDNWEPWQKYQRKKTIPSFNSLESQVTEQPIQQCIITFEKTDQMVQVGSAHYDYDALCKSYINDGKDPCTSENLNWGSVKRLIGAVLTVVVE